eukprot:6206321-Pleurochrysis_carterae.AAC.1
MMFRVWHTAWTTAFFLLVTYESAIKLPSTKMRDGFRQFARFVTMKYLTIHKACAQQIMRKRLSHSARRKLVELSVMPAYTRQKTIRARRLRAKVQPIASSLTKSSRRAQAVQSNCNSVARRVQMPRHRSRQAEPGACQDETA